MSITIVKPKAKPTPVIAPATSVETLEPEKLTDEELVDQYGKLQDAVVALQANPVFAQLSMVLEELNTRLSSNEPEDTIKIIGTDYELEAGTCSKEPRKVIDTLQVLKYIGNEAFAKISKVGVSDAEKYLTPDQFVKVVNNPGYTKNRKLKVSYLGGNKKK